jgi:hypothetical protein
MQSRRSKLISIKILTEQRYEKAANDGFSGIGENPVRFRRTETRGNFRAEDFRNLLSF